MFLNNQNIHKEYRRSFLKIYIGAGLVLIALALLVAGVIKTNNVKKDMVHLNDAILADEDDKYDKIAYLDMVGFFQFATYGDDHGYYIAYDDDFFYLIGFPDKDFDYFASKFDTDEYVTIYGYTKKIPSEAYSYAIESLNEEMGEDYVDYGNFTDVFGDVLLEAKRDNSILGLGSLFDLAATEVFSSVFICVLGLIVLFVGLKSKKSFDDLRDREIELSNEIEGDASIFYDKLKLILTGKHLISYNNNLDVVDYDDIYWVYPTRHSTNGISDYNFLNVCLKNGKRLVCGNGGTFGKKNKASTNEAHENVMNCIAERSPDVKLGYSRENIDAFNDLCKQLKNKQKTGIQE